MLDDDISSEIHDIFEEAQDGYPCVAMNERKGFERDNATELSKIKTLGELFLEYYLQCPSDISSLEEFMKTEKLDKIMSVEDYQKLICGAVYLPPGSLEYFTIKLPFPITCNQLHHLNASVKSANRAAEKLSLDVNFLFNEAGLMRKEILAERLKKYHEYDVRYAEKHREENAAKAKKRYHTDKEYRKKCIEYSHKRYLSLPTEVREKMYEQQRRRYNTDSEFADNKRRANRIRYELQKQKMAEDPEYAAEIREKRRNAKRKQRTEQKENNQIHTLETARQNE